MTLVLVQGESVHVATITEAARADSGIPATAVPIGPSRVDLRVVDDSGGVFPFTAGSVLGRYRVSVPVRLGGRYSMQGTIDLKPVAATTTVPLRLTLLRPSADTVTMTDGVPCGVLFPALCVAYEIAFDDPPAFDCRVAATSGTFESCGGGRSSQGELVFPRDSTIRQVILRAYNRDAGEWLLRGVPRGNITGAFGGFGAALVVRRWLSAP